MPHGQLSMHVGMVVTEHGMNLLLIYCIIDQVVLD
jgi:hypothetical protein